MNFQIQGPAGTVKKEKKRRRRILFETIRTAIATLLLLAVSLLAFAWFHHARPKQRMSAGLITATPTPAIAQALEMDALATPATAASAAPSEEPVATPEPTPVYVPWIEKFADRFSADIVSDENGYTSPDVAIHITKVQYGKASSAMYYLADIYLTDVFQFETVFAKDKSKVVCRSHLDAIRLKRGVDGQCRISRRRDVGDCRG